MSKLEKSILSSIFDRKVDKVKVSGYTYELIEKCYREWQECVEMQKTAARLPCLAEVSEVYDIPKPVILYFEVFGSEGFEINEYEELQNLKCKGCEKSN